jgi:phosphatidylserine/phosphatidylglycerophosphate/cardiolipin synthase-like enzyme
VGANATVTIAVEPESGVNVILNAIKGAQKSIWVEMYDFSDSDVAGALAGAANAGLDVQLLYEPNNNLDVLLPFSSNGQQPPGWAQPNRAIKTNGNPVSYHHGKFMLIDGSTAYIMTTNFTAQALGGNGQVANREYIICDTDPQDAQVLAAIFQADKQGTALPPLPSPTNLIVTDLNAHATLRALLDSAQQSIYIQVEEIKDPSQGSSRAQLLSIEGALLSAAQRIPDVRMMIPPLPGTQTILPTVDNQAAYATLTRAASPVQINTHAQYYMHAKIILVDQRLAYVGSQNLSRESLNYNREVGILISDANVVQTLYTTFMSDWAGAQQPQTSTP